MIYRVKRAILILLVFPQCSLFFRAQCFEFRKVRLEERCLWYIFTENNTRNYVSAEKNGREIELKHVRHGTNAQSKKVSG